MTFPRQVPGIPLRSDIHELRTDVVYAEVGGVPLRFDHYRPVQATGATPGGGLRARRRLDARRPEPGGRQRAPLRRRRHRDGLDLVPPRPGHRFPAPLDDVRHGLRWVRAHAGELGIDPERLALLGVSAGAHLAVLAHLARDMADLAPDLPGRAPRRVRDRCGA